MVAVENVWRWFTEVQMEMTTSVRRWRVGIGWSCIASVVLWFILAPAFQPAVHRIAFHLSDLTSLAAAGQYRFTLSERVVEPSAVPSSLANGSFLFCSGVMIPRHSADGWPAKESLGWHRFDGNSLHILLPEAIAPNADLLTTAREVKFDFEWRDSNVPWRRNLWLWWLGLSLFGVWMARGELEALWRRPWPLILLSGVAPIALLAAVMIRPAALYGMEEEFIGRAIRFWHDMLPAALLLWAIAVSISIRLLHRRTQAVCVDSTSADALTRQSQWGVPAGIGAIMFSFGLLVSAGPGDPVIVDQTGYSAPFCSAAAQSDAQQYEIGNYALLLSGKLPEWNQRRPINTAWSFFRNYFVGMNPLLGLWVQALVVGYAIGRLVQVSTQLWGSPAGVVVLACCWGMVRFFIATSLTESFGLAASALGTTWFIVGWKGDRPWHALSGLGLLTVAQAARPGALLVLPFMGLAWAWSFRAAAPLPDSAPLPSGAVRVRLGRLLLAATVVLVCLSVNPLLNRIYGTGENVTGANFASTFAGLASGCSWSEVEDEFRDQLDAMPNEGVRANFLYAVGWQRIKERPSRLVGELSRGVMRFSIDSLAALSTLLIHSSLGEGWVGRAMVVGLWLLLGLAVVVRLWYSKEMWWRSFVIALLLGTMASVSIVYLDGGIRVLAATWPALFLVLGFGLGFEFPTEATNAFPHKREQRFVCGEMCVVGLLSVGVLFLPMMVVGREVKSSDIAELGQPQRLSIQFVGSPLKIAAISNEAFDLKDFQRAIQIGRLPPVEPLVDAVRSSPQLFQTGFDRASQTEWYIFAAESQAIEPGDSLEVRVLSRRPAMGFVTRRFGNVAR